MNHLITSVFNPFSRFVRGSAFKKYNFVGKRKGLKYSSFCVTYLSMTTTVKQIANSALALSVHERAELAHVIIASIDENRNDWNPAWDNELKKRVGEIRQGRVKGIPVDEVFAKLEEKYH